MVTAEQPTIEERVTNLENRFDNLLTELQQTNAALANIPEDWHYVRQQVGKLDAIEEKLDRLLDGQN